MRKPVLVLLLVLLATSLTACGSDEKPPRTTARTSFEASPYGERVFEAYRQTDETSKILTLPKGTREIEVDLDCVGSQGQLQVMFTTAGGADIQCTTEADAKGGFVILSGDGSLLRRKQTVTITAPNHQEWSAAISAGAKLTSN